VYNTNTSLSLDQISSENESPNYPANQYTDAYLASFEGINTSIKSLEHYSEDDLHENATNNAIQAVKETVPRALSDQQYMVLYNGNAEVIGNFRALNFYKASDINIKEDVRLLIDDFDCRDILMQIDGVAYKFKRGVHASVNKRFVGFIAQQVESVVPEAVQLIDGILHVDYEALLPFLNESIKRNYRDISNIRTENDQLQKSIDILYSEFVKREAIVKYQHNPSSMFSNNAMPNKKKGDSKDHRYQRPFWHWLLFILAGVVLFVGGSVTVYFVKYSNPNNGPHGTPVLLIPDEPPLTRVFNRTTDRIALGELYMATGGANWTNNYGWLTAVDICTWFGIKCDQDNRVAMIKLPSCGLNGTIPASIGHLDHLTDLTLPNNDISGTIPPSLFTIPALAWLDLGWNLRLSGALPDQVVKPPPLLQRFGVNNCNLTGNLPNWLTQSSVRNLYVSDNRFTGTIPLLPALLRGDFQSNQFEGSVPRFIGYVGNINLSNNRLTGTLQSWPIISANNLLLANNLLSGDLSLTESQFRALQMLDISNNNFTTVRSEVLLPPLLTSCDASNNPFKCPIPRWLKTECGATCA
jgi:Leucine-rich repeat (LRR) protein